jgi:hypothetical protein
MNNAPFDPDETHGGSDEDMLDANSMTWGSVDPDFDEMFRERLGPLPLMPTPPYAFERVLVAGRRRRARKVWAGAAAAAFVVMAGTAGTTVALHNGSPGGPVIGEGHPGTSLSATVTPSKSPSASPTPSATTKSPTASTTSAAAGAAATTASPSASTPWCQTADFQLSVSTQAGSSGSTSDTLVIVLTNDSGHTCTTYGYPGLELETQSQQDQTTKVVREDNSAVQTLTVPTGDSISTTATFTAAAAGSTPGADCGAPSYYLAVIPPNEQTQVVQTISGGPITVCGGSGELDTDPFVMGKTGS